MMTARETIAQRRALDAVAIWSLQIHGRGDRHIWCLAAARAVVLGEPMPDTGPGTAFYRRSTAAARLETIRRIAKEHAPCEH